MENILIPDELGSARISKLNKKTTLYVLGFLGVFALLYYFLLSAPLNFPVGAVVRVEPGMSLRSVSLKLKNENIIRSRVAFEVFVIIFDREKHIISSDYSFENKLPVFEVARRISKGEHDMAPISVTIPEGYDVAQIADVFTKKLTNFNEDNFLVKVKDLEGYLFPDTYFFLTTADETDVIDSMSKNFKKKITPLLPEIVASGKTEKNIIIMASIIEREAKGDTDRDIISGILWKRISIGMPLQVDAAPETYKAKGLPGGPICNPGLASIKASIHPKISPYLYYLHDKEGIIHFAKNFAEHTQNKLKYLR
ncbi:MAG: endolytic transglycosylase MltG [Candidatus Paceibacterota bacterium]|jgi:UPF0755 protein